MNKSEQLLNAFAEKGYSIFLGTNRDTAWTSKNNGRHGWRVRVASTRSTPGRRIRFHGVGATIDAAISDLIAKITKEHAAFMKEIAP